MKQILLILLISSIMGLAGYYAGYEDAPKACDDFKFYDIVTDENGNQIPIYAKD